MLATIGKVVWAVGIVAWYVIRHRFERKAKRVQVVTHSRNTVERIGLSAGTLGLGLIPGIYAATGFPRGAGYPPQLWALILGTAVYGAALWLFWRSHFELGENWSQTLELRKGHQLIKRGVYRSIRHPMYASIWLWDLAQGLLLQNWLAGWGALVTFAVMYFVRAPREERMMCEFFGQEYRDYMQQTGRLFPRRN